MIAERRLQNQVKNLETNLPRLLENVHQINPVKSKTVLSFCGTRSRIKPAGFYIISSMGSTESHSLIVEKRGEDSNARFFVFDPNGRKHANTASYALHIAHGNRTNIIPDPSISGTCGWNSGAVCGIWTAVMAVFFGQLVRNNNNSQWNKKDSVFSMNDFTALYVHFNKAGNASTFIKEVQATLFNSTDYASLADADKFKNDVTERLISILSQGPRRTSTRTTR